MKTISSILIILSFHFCISEPTRVPNSDYPADTWAENSDTKELYAIKITQINPEPKPIMEATLEGDIDKVKSLLKAGIYDLNEKDSNGDTALHYATGYQVGTDAQHLTLVSEIKIVKLLLQNKAEVNIKNNSGETPLIYASFYCERDMIQLLLDFKANANLETMTGDIPLHYGIRCSLPFVKLLVENTISLNKKNLNGKTPLALAKEIQNGKVISYLISQGAK